MMSRRLDEDDESILPQREQRLREASLHTERELTLGTGAILGICFGLVLLCGAFFGFGYKLGSSASRTAGAGSSSDTPAAPAVASSPSTFNTFKPSAGSPAGGATAPTVAGRSDMPVLTTPPGTSAAPAAATRGNAAADSEASAEVTTPAAPPPAHTAPAPAASAPSAPATMPMPAISATGTFVVQVAAVSHTEDADLLVNALHAKGYTVAARTEPGDRLVHIQVGPFHDKKDAEAMRQRLLSDGYNAFIK